MEADQASHWYVLKYTGASVTAKRDINFLVTRAVVLLPSFFFIKCVPLCIDLCDRGILYYTRALFGMRHQDKKKLKRHFLSCILFI